MTPPRAGTAVHWIGRKGAPPGSTGGEASRVEREEAARLHQGEHTAIADAERSGALCGPRAAIVATVASCRDVVADPRATEWKGAMLVAGARMREEDQGMDDRFFDLSIDMLCIVHFSGYFKRLNPAWERTLGFTREELLSKPMFDFVHPGDRRRTLDQNREVRSGGQALSFENRYLCSDGSYKWLLWNATPDFDHQVIYGVGRDITGRKRAEAEREKLLQELQAALAEVRELQAILPICMYCKNIRNDGNYWQSVEEYISHHTKSRFSHSICPSCYKTLIEPQIDDMNSK
jgi:PAS domain S-box-containing protein